MVVRGKRCGFHSGPLTEVEEFMNGTPCSGYDAGYRLAIAAIHQGFPDGSMVLHDTYLSNLLKGIYVVTARPRTLRETWASQRWQ